MTAPNCDAIRSMLSDLVASALDPTAAGHVAEHLSVCPNCRALIEVFVRQDLALAELAGNAQQEAMAARIHNALRPQHVASQASSRPAAIVAYPLGDGWDARQAAATVPWWAWGLVGTAAAIILSLSAWFLQSPKPKYDGPRVVIQSPPVANASPREPVEEPAPPPKVAASPQATEPKRSPEPPKPVALAILTSVEGNVALLNNGGTPASTGQPLFPDCGLETHGEGSSATIQYPDMTTVRLSVDTHVQNLRDADGKRLELVRGVVTADVAPQPRGRPMVLTTPKAQAVVLGTKLRLTSGENSASLLVEKGRVRFVRQEDGQALEVPQGHYAVVAKDVEFAIRPIAPSTPRWTVLREHTAAVTAAAFAPDGRTLATASNDANVKLWDPATKAVRLTLKGHTAPIEALAFSPDGQTLASASWDRTIRLWDVPTGKMRKVLEGHLSTVFCVAFAPDGQTLASGSSDKTIKLWNLATGKEQTSIEGHQGAVRSVAFAPQGKLLASGGADGMVAIWDPATGKNLRQFRDHTGWIYRVAIAADNSTVVAGSGDGAVHLWDVNSGLEQQRLTGHTKRITGLALTADGQRLASSSMDGSIRFWEIASGKEVERLSGEPLGEVAAIALAPDGKSLAIGNWDGTLVFWDLTKGSNPE
jgi:WD40 repeat protein